MDAVESISGRKDPTVRATLLNVGCGRRFSQDERWLNVDLSPTSSHVMQIDASGGLPFGDMAFSGVYHSHVLEHLDPAAGRQLLQECFRVLRTGGILRIAVPDLERIAASYLQRLAEARQKSPHSKRRYEWAVLELCDQMTRTQSCGGVIDFLSNPEPAGRAYAVEQCGEEIRLMIESLDRQPNAMVASGPARWHLRPTLRRWREKFIQVVLGKQYAALNLGRFQASGEIHRWMYDSYSLSELLTEVGFGDVRVTTATESGIPDWATFELDADAKGVTRKSDSLFVEGTKRPPVVPQG
jgi:predicted SAM-dependent methyltransferase